MQEASREHSSVQFHGYIIKQNFDRSLAYRGIISKFMPCGSLDDVLHKQEVLLYIVELMLI